MRRRYCSQTDTQAKKHEKQRAGARNVQAGGKCCERERERETRRQTGVWKLEQPGSKAGDKAGRQTV